jgi:enoyl-CoA hydratase
MTDAVLTEVRDRILLITLNRPDAMNAINADVARGLLDAIELLDRDDTLVAGVMTGAGRGFCAGMDLKAFAASGTPQDIDAVFRGGSRKPMIAAIERFALAGGLELALTCDLIVAARGAKLGIPEVGVGLFAAGGALLRLPGRVPYGVAMEMALTGDPITAEEAHAHGLVARLAEPLEAAEVATRLAERIAKNAPLAVAASKQVIQQTRGRTEAESWELQSEHIKVVFRSADGKEGARAFAEKRPPVWSGR